MLALAAAASSSTSDNSNSPSTTPPTAAAAPAKDGPDGCRKCPYCTDRPATAPAGSGKTRRRRNRSTERQRNRFAAWWKSLGYQGEKYCSRCSENFRDHLIRQTSNSAGCTRRSPCSDCAQILAHFPEWAAMQQTGDATRLVGLEL